MAATTLPAASNFTANSVTEAQFKTNLTNLVAFIGGLLGTSGLASDARSALGLGNLSLQYNVRGGWATGISYLLGDVVTNNGISYLCVIANTSSVFSMDYSSGSWVLCQGVTESELTAKLAQYSNLDGAGLIGSISYAQLRAYSGAQTTVNVWGISNVFDGAAGYFKVNASDTTSADNGGTILVDAMGRRWHRVFIGDVNILWFGADPAGVSDSSPAIRAAIASVTGGVILHPAGTYLVATPVPYKNGIIYQGEGVSESGIGTKINYTGTGDGFLIQNPINSSTAAHIQINDIWFNSNNLTSDNGILFDTGSTYVQCHRCKFTSTTAGIPVILDQSELWDFYNCSFNFITGAVWLVNGIDKNASSNPGYTNRIAFHACDFNGIGSGVWDDGGNSHRFVDCSFNACSTHISATGVHGLIIEGGEFEVWTSAMIFLSLTTRKGRAGAKSENVSINRTMQYNNNNLPTIVAVAGACGTLEYNNNHMNTASTNPLNGVAASCDNVIAEGNVQIGSGAGGASINNYFDDLSFTPTWGAATTAPAIGNGSILAKYSRKGRLITARIQLNFGTTTTFGAGAWNVSMPVTPNVSNVAQLGPAWLQTVGGYFSAIARIFPGSAVAQFFVNANASAVAQGVPNTWASGHAVEFEITYTASLPI